MSLTILPVPQEAVAALAAELPRLAGSSTVAARLPRTKTAVTRFMTARNANPAEQPDLSLPWFVLDIPDVPKGLTAAHQVGWRYVLSTGDPSGPVLADTAIRGSNRHVFAGLAESPYASDLQARIAALPEDPAVFAGSYTAALLQVPPCYVMAIWLQDNAHHEDLVVPVAPAPPPLTAGRLETASQFLDALHQVRPSVWS
jgi:hypothetical protein